MKITANFFIFKLSQFNHTVVPTVAVTVITIISTTMVTLAALQLMRKLRCLAVKKELIQKGRE